MLDGIRVLDLTQYLSGPTSTLLMARLGADVIKVEPGPRGDLARLLPIIEGETSSYFVQQNRGKRSICIDLSTDEGIALVRRMAAECDVLVENFAQGVLERKGLGPDRLRADNPGLIYASISAYGRTGSKSHLPGFDLIAQAYGGMTALTGEPDGAPISAGAPMADVSAGYLAFAAIGHALFARTRTGEGQFIDTSMVDAIFAMHPFAVQGPSVTNGKARLKRTGRHFGSVPPAGTYKGPDGWIVLQVLDAQWPRLCEAAAAIGLGDDERFTDSRLRQTNKLVLMDVLQAWMDTYESNEALLAHLEAHRLPAAPVVDPADAHLDPWFIEQGAVVEVEDPDMGTMRVPGVPLRMSAMPDRPVEPPAPQLGQQSTEILADLLSMSTDEIAALAAAKTISRV